MATIYLDSHGLGLVSSPKYFTNTVSYSDSSNELRTTMPIGCVFHAYLSAESNAWTKQYPTAALSLTGAYVAIIKSTTASTAETLAESTSLEKKISYFYAKGSTSTSSTNTVYIIGFRVA